MKSFFHCNQFFILIISSMLFKIILNIKRSIEQLWKDIPKMPKEKQIR